MTATPTPNTPPADARKVDAPECHGLDTPERVCFYEQDFYVLSNFSAFAISIWGRDFPTSEHAYHWAKFRDTNIGIATAIRLKTSAHEAFKFAEKWKGERRKDWDAVKVDVMREVLWAKVAQHEYVRRKLLDTGDRELVENSWRDSVWGWGPNRDGQNLLGKLWMEIRAELRAGRPLPPSAPSPSAQQAVANGGPGDASSTSSLSELEENDFAGMKCAGQHPLQLAALSSAQQAGSGEAKTLHDELVEVLGWVRDHLAEYVDSEARIRLDALLVRAKAQHGLVPVGDGYPAVPATPPAQAEVVAGGVELPLPKESTSETHPYQIEVAPPGWEEYRGEWKPECQALYVYERATGRLVGSGHPLCAIVRAATPSPVPSVPQAKEDQQ